MMLVRTICARQAPARDPCRCGRRATPWQANPMASGTPWRYDKAALQGGLWGHHYRVPNGPEALSRVCPQLVLS